MSSHEINLEVRKISKQLKASKRQEYKATQ